MDDESNPDAPVKALPREISPSVFWLGDCLAVPYKGRELHGYNSLYLVCGDECSALVEGGHPQDLPVVDAQLDALLNRGLPPLRYMFVSHTETPHSSAAGRVLQRFPDVEVCGSVLDLALVFPQFAHRLHPLDPGDALDLGGTELRIVESVIRDLPFTRWAFETRGRVLFPGDGFAFAHYHEDRHCGLLAEEAVTLDLPEMAALFADIALYWTRFVDMEPYLAALEQMLGDLDVRTIAPAHGLPITAVAATFPRVREGLLLGSSRTAAPDVV